MKRLWIGVLILCMCASSAWGADVQNEEQARRDVRNIVKHIQARYEKTKDLQADFVQKTKIEGFERPVTSAGKVYLKKPGRLRWDYLDPANEQIYVTHDDVKVYVPEHKQVLIGKLTHMAASQAPLQLLQGVGKLEESFDIQPTTGKERGIGDIRLITLIPKEREQESARNLQKIIVEVFPKTYFLRTVSLYEISGNVATFEFSALKPNAGLTNELFDFKIPADVEVVRAPVLNGP
ncbi:MAG: outer membrane lipoprotein carrier protein LolA [Nitrospira sp.]|nr:outer membrane lipoprotein carrier protein LolA [Nitrospira sp.]